MTTNLPAEPRGARTASVVRELLGLALIVAGVTGAVAMLFLVDWRLGTAGCCAFVVLTGAVLVMPGDDTRGA